MPKIIAASHALPPHIAPQSVVRDLVQELFANQVEELERLLAIFDHARIETRQFMMPLDWYLAPHPPSERTRIYQVEGLELMLQAAARCLEQAGCAPTEIDQIIVVSSTGHATPTLDAHLINRLGLQPTTTRLPLWGLGCAGGVIDVYREVLELHGDELALTEAALRNHGNVSSVSVLLVLVQGGRYWCIISLGEQWNTRILLVPAAPVQRRGPYRWLRHPNYLIVILEFLLLPLLLRAPLTFLICFPINLLLLRRRIRLEEAALRQFSDYSVQFPQR